MSESLHPVDEPNPPPRTPAGKIKSSRNAVTHGCCSKTVILPDESQEEFDQLLEDWLDDYQPTHHAHRVLVEKAVRELWFMMRNTNRYAAFELSLYPTAPSDWTPEQHHELERFTRYKTTAERSFQRSFTLLEQLRKRRDRLEAQQLTHDAPPKKQSASPSRDTDPTPESESAVELLEKSDGPFIHGLEQWVDVTRDEHGSAITTVEPSNAQLLDDLALMSPPPEMVRRQFYFHDGVPDEYAWCCESDEERATRTYGVQRMTIETWLAALEHEKVSGHLSDTGKDLPPPNQISDCPCWCLPCQRNIAIREKHEKEEAQL
jgi:hypothetical protein